MEAEAGGATRGGVGHTMTNRNILSASGQTNLPPSRRVGLRSSAQLATIHFRLRRDFRKDGTGRLRQGQWKMKRGRPGRSLGLRAGSTDQGFQVAHRNTTSGLVGSGLRVGQVNKLFSLPQGMDGSEVNQSPNR